MENNRWQSWLTKKLSNAKPFFVLIAFSPWLIILWVYVSDYSLRLKKEDLEIIGSFIEWFGTAYSLFLALVLANAWNQYDTLDREFDQELDALISLYDSIMCTQDTLGNANKGTNVDNVVSKIRNYLRHVIENYQIEGVHSQQRRNGDMILESIGREISSWAHQKILAEPFVNQLFSSLNSAIDIRGDRISHSKQSIPKTVWAVAIISSVLWLLPFLALRINDQVINVLMKGGVAFIITIVLIIISDLDNPFEGTWKIDLESWVNQLEIIQHSPQIIFVFSIRYNITDQLRDLIGTKNCKLSKFSRAGFLGLSWKKFLNALANRYSNKVVKSISIFLDQFSSWGYASCIEIDKFPSIILRTGDNFEEIISAQDINQCADLEHLKKMVFERLDEKISCDDEVSCG